MFLSLTKSIILWHNTKLKTIGANVHTVQCVYTRLLQMLQCCSVVSVECCMFSVYISHIPQYLHIYRFTHCWLTLCSPVQTVGRMQPRKQTITRLHTLLSVLCHSYFGQISQNPSRLKMLHTAMRHIPAIASQIELSCLTPLKI